MRGESMQTSLALLHDKLFPLPLRERVRVRGVDPLPSRKKLPDFVAFRYTMPKHQGLGLRWSVLTPLVIFCVFVAASIALAGPLDSPGAQKSLVCSACHGFGGNAPAGAMPKLAGMNANYFKKAIKDYSEGKRPSPEMEPYSKYVLQFGVDEVAEYFAGQKSQPI